MLAGLYLCSLLMLFSRLTKFQYSFFWGGDAWDVLVIIFLGKLSIYLFKIFIYRCYEKVSKANQFQEKYIKYTLTIESSQWLADRAKKGE